MEHTTPNKLNMSYKNAYIYLAGSLIFLALFILISGATRLINSIPEIQSLLSYVLIFAYAISFVLCLRERGKLKKQNEVFLSFLDESILPRRTQGFSILAGLALTVINYVSLPYSPSSAITITIYYLGLGIPVSLFILASAYITASVKAD